MNWFTRLCRNTGLMIHHVVKPGGESQRIVVDKDVQEKELDESVTLRRTTIDEIEVRKKRVDSPSKDQ